MNLTPEQGHLLWPILWPILWFNYEINDKNISYFEHLNMISSILNKIKLIYSAAYPGFIVEVKDLVKRAQMSTEKHNAEKVGVPTETCVFHGSLSAVRQQPTR